MDFPIFSHGIFASRKVETLPFRSAARLSFDVQKGEMTGPSGRASAFLAKQDRVWKMWGWDISG